MTNSLTNNGNELICLTNDILISLGNGCHSTGEVCLDGACDVNRCGGKFCSLHRGQL